MDHFKRLIFLCIFLAPAFFSNSAFAFEPDSRYELSGFSSQSGQAVCDHAKSLSNDEGPWTFVDDPSYYKCTRADNPYNPVPISKQYKCSDEVDWSYSYHTCTAPPPPSCTSGTEVSSGFYPFGSNPSGSFPLSTCTAGCVAAFAGNWPAGRSCENGTCTYYGEGGFYNTGATCTNQPATPLSVSAIPKTTDEQNMAAATAAADLAAKAALDARTAANQAANQAKLDAVAAKGSAANAAQRVADTASAVAAAAAAKAAQAALDAASTEATRVAVMGDSNSTQSQKDAATSAASAAAAASSAAGADSGSKSADAGSKAADAASKAGEAAKAAADKVESDPPKSLCESHPHIAACQVNGVNAGFCFEGDLRGFTCNGDAIQCATIQFSAKVDCRQTKDQDKYLTLFNANAANAVGASPVNSVLASGENINITDLNHSTPFGRECPPDVEFSIGGTMITLPISDWCPYMALVGDVFLALAYLWAARTLVGAV